MNTRRIKSLLNKKGIPFIKIDVQRGNAVCETEWFIEFTEGTIRDLIAASNGDLSKEDFQYSGGDAENAAEFIEMLPSLKGVSA